MKSKFLALVPFLLLTACQNSYSPDLSLKTAWTVELEKTQPSEIPYGLIYETDSKTVIYVAVNSSDAVKTDALIESLIEKWKPQIVLCQGHTKDVVSPTDVRFKLHNVRPILKGASAERAQTLNHMASLGISERDFEIYLVINFMNQIWQYEVHSPEDLQNKVEHYLTTNPDAKALHITYAEIKKWFQEKTGIPMTQDAISNGTLTAPEDPEVSTTTYLQKLSFYQDEIDDAVAMETLATALRQYNTVMIIRAASKYVVEREVLHKMLGVSEPVKVVQ